VFTLFLCGDVMTGRGVDQILRHPSKAELRESYVRYATQYVQLAEQVSGPIPRGVDGRYIWGDALEELARIGPDVRIANLETAVTQSDDFWPKRINYRMHPANVDCLTAAGLHVCTLANNHVMDFGYAGLIETVDTLTRAGIHVAGAGRDSEEATQPARRGLAGGGHLLVFSFGCENAGVPPSWVPDAHRPGLAMLEDLSEATAASVLSRVAVAKCPGDLVIVSIHWGSNWGYAVPRKHVRFARWLVDGGVDLVHGHSSHHARPIEVYRDRLILYGCGDLITDYEGIPGEETYRPELVLMYFVTLAASGRLERVRLTPMRSRRLRLNRAPVADAVWLAQRLGRMGARYGTRLEVAADGTLELRWN